jgi:FkbM family methyltransferase
MEFFSQVGQDRFLFENFFRGKRNGVFVDIGAYDGVKFSNSLFFERALGWSGLCIEPLPSAFAKLSAARCARCLQLCVSDFEGSAEFVECDAGIDEKMLSGLVRHFDPRHSERVRNQASGGRSLQVPVRKLSDVLTEQDLYEIDFCSIDTEGAEISILSELDTERFRVAVFAVENNYDEPALRELMAAKDYDLVARLEHDDIYARRGVKRLAQTTVICAAWHGEKDRDALALAHAENLAHQSEPVTPVYVFDGGARPPRGLEGSIIRSNAALTIYEAWNLALATVETPFVMNLNLDDRLAPDAVATLRKALLDGDAGLAGGDWKVCYSQAETDAVQPCYPADALPFSSVWPPPSGTRTRLGSGTGDRTTFGPATLWRMDAHVQAPRYPARFGDGAPITIIGDVAWWLFMQNGLKRKAVRVPQVIGNYHSHPGNQAEFRTSVQAEREILSRIGARLS